MNKRETFKEQDFFDKEVVHNEEWLKKFAEIVANPATAPEHRRRLLHTIFRQRFEQLILRYSRGEPVSSLRDSLSPIVESLATYHREPGHAPWRFEEFDSYIFSLWLVSWAILLNVDDGLFQNLLRELNNVGQDALYERLVTLRISGRPQTQTLMYPNPYASLLQALDATGEEQIRLIQKFLKSYYKGMKSAYWHDSHLGEDAGFFGYWCFELAAFTKELGIDDRAFSDNIFYPVDLVRESKQLWG
jgi:PoNe immunity proteins (PoNi), C-terminal/PoNe immunity protein (PoNi), N-terminal